MGYLRQPNPEPNEMSKIGLENMEFYAYHGCYETEKIVGGRFIVDVYIEANIALAAQTDSIENAIDYQKVYEIVKSEMAISSALLEHVTRRILRTVHKVFPVITGLEVKVAKLSPPISGKMDSVSVTMDLKDVL